MIGMHRSDIQVGVGLHGTGSSNNDIFQGRDVTDTPPRLTDKSVVIEEENCSSTHAKLLRELLGWPRISWRYLCTLTSRAQEDQAVVSMHCAQRSHLISR